MSRVEPLRHLSVFSPHAFGNRRIDVVGCGATGSRIALSLAKLGLENIHCHDFDTVEAHNIANQTFGVEDIGKLKIDALSAQIKSATGTEIKTYNQRVDAKTELGEIAFLLTDSMSSRKEIWDGALRYKLRTSLLIETRMGADAGRIYTVNPTKPRHVAEYEKTLYTDAEAEVSACGASTSVGPTAEIISGLAVWQMIRWFSIEKGADDILDNEIIISLRSMMAMSRQW